MNKTCLILLLLCVYNVILSYSFHKTNKLIVNTKISSIAQLNNDLLDSVIVKSPYSDIIPFLSEHIQLSDQILFLGASTDMSLSLLKDGYGTKLTGRLTVIDNDNALVNDLNRVVNNDNDLKKYLGNRLTIHTVDENNLSSICKQSTFDSIVDYGLLGTTDLDFTFTSNSILLSEKPDKYKTFLNYIDNIQNAVRLGNILICLSTIEKEIFCKPFEERFGWVQELDGDPGEISQWYRGKTNIQATASNFKKHGLKMYVYTNTDNC